MRGSQAYSSLKSPGADTIRVNRLFDSEDVKMPPMSAKNATNTGGTTALPSTFKRSGGGKKAQMPANLSELESLNVQYGIFERKNEEDSPTSVKMKSTAILQNTNKSFDQYFHEMRKRRHDRLRGLGSSI